jgi:hypothetical protein
VVRRSTRGAIRRGHCGDCGGALLYEDADIPGDELYVAVAAFDEPDRLKPTAHAYWSRRLPWMALADALPKFAGTSRRRSGGPELERIG